MTRPHSRDTFPAAALGALAGMRSMAAPALVAFALGRAGRRDDERASHRLRRAFASSRTARTLGVLAAGELVADKMPWVPARIRPLPLTGRALTGALAATAARESPREVSTIRLAVVGAATAVASAGLMYAARRAATSCAGVSNLAAGLAEDALAATVAFAALRGIRSAASTERFTASEPTASPPARPDPAPPRPRRSTRWPRDAG